MLVYFFSNQQISLDLTWSRSQCVLVGWFSPALFLSFVVEIGRKFFSSNKFVNIITICFVLLNILKFDSILLTFACSNTIYYMWWFQNLYS